MYFEHIHDQSVIRHKIIIIIIIKIKYVSMPVFESVYRIWLVVQNLTKQANSSVI
jgi:antibiotic biosynthesis monooxygenase (ABM) superfamily enzyme